MHFAYGAITLWGAASQQLLLYRRLVTLSIQVWCSHLTTPLSEDNGLGFSFFARRYLGNIVTYVTLFSFPPGTEMFHFPEFASRRRYPAD